MSHGETQIEAVFLRALEIQSPRERAAYLAQACAGDHELRRRVERMLAAQPQLGSFLDQNAAEMVLTSDQPPLECPGTQIGPYKLLQQIGEGGFGVVYMAEQQQPVRRKVALKIIKPGMDTREVIARFEQERQALALMDHPNIAKVFDAGTINVVRSLREREDDSRSESTTLSGRPYFVMELVKGVPLTEFCDKNHLSLRERLKLFVNVCHAIQHAHQKGVIHRDLKPTNIMVTLHDGKPVPKVIDFGVSKALSKQLTEKTLFTAYGQMVGTPAYMSPEQAEMSGLDIDTRSDVYSLGVLLYELLTGATPFDPKRLRSAGYAEMQRIIREEEPPKPSTRLTTMGEELSVVSTNRGSDPKKLGQFVRGELDWIVMKALDKERDRRYETANGFAADVERFLNDEAVVACPPSAAYKFRKFARKNKTLIATTAAIALSLILGTSVATWQAIRATQARDRAIIAERNAEVEAAKAREEGKRARSAESAAKAETERASRQAAIAREVQDFLNNDLLAEAGELLHYQPDDDAWSRDANIRVRKLLDRASRSIGGRFQGQPLVEAEIRRTIGRAYHSLGLDGAAASHLERAQELCLDAVGPDHIVTSSVQNHLANVYMAQQRFAEAESLYQSLLRRAQKEARGADDSTTRLYQANLGTLYLNAGRFAESETTLQEALNSYERVYGSEHPYPLQLQRLLAMALAGQQRYSEAHDLLSATSAVQHRLLGPTHPDTLMTQFSLGWLYAERRQYGKAVPLYYVTIEMAKEFPGLDHPLTRKIALAFGSLLTNIGRHDEAIVLYRELVEHNPEDVAAHRGLGSALHLAEDVRGAVAALQQAKELAGDDDGRLVNLGRALKELQEIDAAIEAFEQSFEYFAKKLDQAPQREEFKNNLRAACVNLSRALREQDRLTEAAEFLKRARELGVNGQLFWLEYALCQRALGNEGEYEEGCANLIAGYPPVDERNVADWGHLSQQLYRLGKYKEALAGLERTIELRKDDGPSLEHGPRWWYYTLTLGQLGQTEQARTHYQQLAAIMRENPPRNPRLVEGLKSEAEELLGIEPPSGEATSNLPEQISASRE